MAIDINCVLRASTVGTLSATETGTGKQLGHDLKPMVWMAYVGDTSGTDPKLDIVITESTTDGSYHPVGAFQQIIAPGTYYTTVKANEVWRNYVATVTGTTPKFGSVTGLLIAAVPAGRDTKW